MCQQQQEGRKASMSCVLIVNDYSKSYCLVYTGPDVGFAIGVTSSCTRRKNRVWHVEGEADVEEVSPLTGGEVWRDVPLP